MSCPGYVLIVINVDVVGRFIVCFLEENSGIFVISNNVTVVKTRYSMLRLFLLTKRIKQLTLGSCMLQIIDLDRTY